MTPPGWTFPGRTRTASLSRLRGLPARGLDIDVRAHRGRDYLDGGDGNDEAEGCAEDGQIRGGIETDVLDGGASNEEIQESLRNAGVARYQAPPRTSCSSSTCPTTKIDKKALRDDITDRVGGAPDDR